MSEYKDILIKIGLNDKLVLETIKNAILSKTIFDLCVAANVENGCDKEKGKLIYQLATKFPMNNEKIPCENRSFINTYIRDNKITNEKQLKFALDYVLNKIKPKEVMGESHRKAFEEASGVGIVVTDENINDALNKRFEENMTTLKEERYTFNAISIFNNAKKDLPWGDDKKMKELFDKKLLEILGPKSKDDEEMIKKKKNTKVEKKEVPKKEEVKKEEVKPETTLKDNVEFHKPEENLQPREILLETHLKSTGNRVMTRFPPEPNGFLHLGHCKAMNLSFNYAKKHGGFCYMRFDDTNPHTEKQEYIDSALENIKWLGHRPYKITYASDYFEQLYEFAIQLIKNDKAYVCHMTGDEIAKSREERTNSPYRNRPIEESLKLFEDMRKGKIAEGKATLRLKMDMSSDNPNMRDLVAYRIKFAPHPHVGDKWCIYPSYDYTHCICDSIENITHSLCTLEFQVRNENYRWLLDALDIYRSPQIEYSRVNLTYTVLSKRRLIKLVDEKHVNGWDDPRMPTINGMRRRGYSSFALNSFCESIGITKSHNIVRLEVLEHEVRSDLNEVAKRSFGVLDPLEVHITNYPEEKVEYVEAVDFPSNVNSTKHKIPFTNTVYIESTDFKEKDFKNFYGLAPGKRIRLRYAYVIEATSFEKNDSGKITRVLAKYIPNEEIEKNPKGVLHWVARTKDGSSPLVSEVRLYDTLFTEEEPGKKTGNFLDDINPNSLVVKSNAYLDISLKGAKPFDKFQLERVGFFSVDTDSKNDKLVLNLTVSLKESKDRKNLVVENN